MNFKLKKGIPGTIVFEGNPPVITGRDLLTSGHMDSDYYGGILVAESLISEKVSEVIIERVNAMEGIENPTMWMRFNKMGYEELNKLDYECQMQKALLAELTKAITNVRKLQKEYFATRNNLVLKQSKHAEKMLDELLLKLEGGAQ